MKKTAVEWLEEQMKTWGDKPRWMRDDIVEQAKAMEKEQMKNAYWYGEYDGHNGSDRNFEQYYNENYGKDESKTD